MTPQRLPLSQDGKYMEVRELMGMGLDVREACERAGVKLDTWHKLGAKS